MNVRIILRCFLGLLLGLCGTGCGGGESKRLPDIVLITLDTTRADRLGCYGYPRGTTPHLDALAAESVVYQNAYSTSSWTLPAHASLFTGKFPTSHGARYDVDGPLKLTRALDGPWEQYRARGLAVGEVTLARLLREAGGYRTGAVVAGPWMKTPFGLDDGFDHYDDDGITQLNGRAATDVTDAALAWLDSVAGSSPDDQPFFLFLNYFDPHQPYAAPAPFQARFASPSDLADGASAESLAYDAEIAYMDAQIGRVLDSLRQRGMFDDCWIIVTADHGELLGELGLWGHAMLVSEPEIRVPLLLKEPRVPAGREQRRAQLVDVLPTLAERLGLPLPSGVQGGSLPDVGHPIVAEFHPIPPWNTSGDWRALFHQDLKYVWNEQGQSYLVDVTNDPYEAVDLSEQQADTAARMHDLLQAWFAGLPPPGVAGPAQDLDPELLGALEELGYTR